MEEAPVDRHKMDGHQTAGVSDQMTPKRPCVSTLKVLELSVAQHFTAGWLNLFMYRVKFTSDFPQRWTSKRIKKFSLKNVISTQDDVFTSDHHSL